jgi:hypothetical protein
MARWLGLSLMVCVLGTAIVACGGSTDGSEPAGASEDALRSYDRQTVYDEVKSSAHAPKDLLSAGVTDARLVAAVGWLVDQSPPSFYISAIRSDHHNDGQAAHAGGHALDMYAKNGGDAKRLIQLLNADPYVVEIGLGGAYKTYRSQITHKAYFDDNSATHVHIGIMHAFGHCSGTCDKGASADGPPPAPPPPAPPPANGPDDPTTPTSPTDPPVPDVTCASATLGVNVPPGTCVKHAADGEWYVCDGNAPGTWPPVASHTDAKCTSCPQLPDGTCQ